MSPWPRSCSAPCSPRMVRLSILEVTWKEMRVGKFALIGPVMTSTEGRWVARMTWMPEARAICARRCTAPSMSLPATLIRSAISSTMTTNYGWLFPLGLGVDHARVVAVDVAHAELRHLLVALLHLAHRPLEGHHGLLGVG